jgi:hypothetical protein
MILNFDKRIREITLKASSLSGIINTSQINKPIQFESSLERDFIYLLEFDIEVDNYLEQPIEIRYNDSFGNEKKYIPDFAISYHDKRPHEIIEIKYESTLQSTYDDLLPKFQAAEQFCKENDFVFKVITEDYIRKQKHIELENFKFLSRYRSYFNNINFERSAFPSWNSDVLYLCEKMSKLQNCTVKFLVDQCAKDDYKKAELLFLTWYLVAMNFITADFSSKLNTNSSIWYNK